jgi:hypothetical protein
MIIPKIVEVKIEKDENSQIIANLSHFNLIVKVLKEILEKAYLYDSNDILLKDINNNIVFSNDSEIDFFRLDYEVKDINDFIKEVL